MKVNKNTLNKIAHLARLHFDGQDEESMLASLNQILDWMEVLNELDTSDVEPLMNLSQELSSAEELQVRPDEVFHTLPREKALKLAPQKDDQFFQVPKVKD